MAIKGENTPDMAPSTPKRNANQASPISTRLRSRNKSKSTLSDEHPSSEETIEAKSPTGKKTRRTSTRKSLSTEDTPNPSTQDPDLTTPRRSTRSAARKATEQIHEVAELMGARRRTRSTSRTPTTSRARKPKSAAESFSSSPETGDNEGYETAHDTPVKPNTKADDISDLSDVDDPHFTKIMSAEAESTAISAIESLNTAAESLSVPTSNAETAPQSVHGESNDATDSDDDDGAPEMVPAKKTSVKQIIHSIATADGSDDDDEAPELITNKSQKPATKVDGEATDETVEETQDQTNEKNEKEAAARENKKRRRARARKNKAAAKEMKRISEAMEAAERLKHKPANTLPSEIPEGLRLKKRASDEEKQSRKKTNAQDSEGKLDPTVLASFAQELEEQDASGEEESKKNKRRKTSKRHARKSKALMKDGSRIVSGFRVAVNSKPSTGSLLYALSQKPKEHTKSFARKHSSKSAERGNFLASMSRSRARPSINFFAS